MKKLFTILILLLSFINIHADDEIIIANKKILQIKSAELINKGMYKDAIRLIEKGILKYPDNDYLIALLGSGYKGLKDIEKAEIYFQKALEINPNNEFALAYIEETKKTKELLKNSTQEEVYDFLKDKGVDLLFIFLGFLAGELLASLILKCDKENWRLLLYKIQLKQQKDLNILNPKYLIKIANKYIFESACPLKTVLVFITLLITFVLFSLVIEFIIGSEYLLSIKSNDAFLEHLLEISIIASFILILLWILKIIVTYNKKEEEQELRLLRVMHTMYQNQEVFELHIILKELSNVNSVNNMTVYIKEYIIDQEEKKLFEKYLNGNEKNGIN
jgi:tetratricopeptide (TPR) repeat protein